jgi:hypothetical protein
MRGLEAGRAGQALACARTGAWAAAGGETGAAPGGGWGFSLITTAETQKSPSKARTTDARMMLARRCRLRSSRGNGRTDGDLGLARPGTPPRRPASAQLGLDAERSKIGMGCLCPLFVPQGLASSVCLAMPEFNKSGDCHNCIVRSGLPKTKRDALTG